MESRLGYPKDEELIYATCFIMAKNTDGRRKIKGEERSCALLNCFTGLTRHFSFSILEESYSPELDLFRSGKAEVCRMIMFSTQERSRTVDELRISNGAERSHGIFNNQTT